jgi:hypothetical protein
MIDYEKFHRDGYGVYNLEDLLLPEDIVKFNKLSDDAQQVPITDENYHYTLSVKGFHNDPNWPFKVLASDRESRLKMIAESGFHDTQRWHESTNDRKDLKKEFQQVVYKFIRNFYPEVNKTFSNVHHQDAVTVYLDGDHTEVHRDGQNQGRLCAILMYLTPEEEYNNSGDLIIIGDEQTADNVSVPVKPVRGKVAILDFINHNPFHGVLPVKPDFIRHCYLTFVWNTDKMPENIRPQGYK